MYTLSVSFADVKALHRALLAQAEARYELAAPLDSPADSTAGVQVSTTTHSAITASLVLSLSNLELIVPRAFCSELPVIGAIQRRHPHDTAGDVNAVRTLNAQIASQKMIGLLDYKNPKEAARREAEMQVSQQIAAMGAAGGVTTGEAQYLRSLAYAKFGLAPSGHVEHVRRILGIPSATRALKQAGKYNTGTVGYNRLVAALAAHPRNKDLAETLLQAEKRSYYGQYGTNAKYGHNNWGAGIYSNSFAPNALGQRGEVGYAEALMRRGGMRGQATQSHYADLRVAQHADTLKSKDYTYLADKATADHNKAAAADFKGAAEHAKQQATIIKQAADKMHEKLDAHISKEDMAALQQAITESNKALAGSISSAIVSGARSIISKK